MGFTFTPATKRQAKLRMALIGPAGSGKTYTSLAIGTRLGERVALIDTERGSAAKYADDFRFDTLALDSFSQDIFIEAIRAAEEAGYEVLIIDSLSAAWTGKDGALEQVDMVTKRSRSKNAFSEGWNEVSPQHNRMIDTILTAKMHVICTMRTKTEWVIEDNPQGKKVPRKIGLQPVQRRDLDYEFDVTADMDHDNNLIVDKTRCKAVRGRIFPQAGEDVATILLNWLDDGAPALESPLFTSIKTELATASTPDELSNGKKRIIRARNEKALTPKELTDLIDIGVKRHEELRLLEANGAAAEDQP